MKYLLCMNIAVTLGCFMLMPLLVTSKFNSSPSQSRDINNNMAGITIANDSLNGLLDVGQNIDVDFYSCTIVDDTPGELSDKCDNDGIYTSLVYAPEYPGGVQAFLEYLNDNFIYPRDAAEAHVRGVIIVRFIVEKDGSISNAKVVRRVAPDNANFPSEKLSLLDDESVRLVNGMPKWIPGIHNGEFVRAYSEVPVRVKINRSQNSNNSINDVVIW